MSFIQLAPVVVIAIVVCAEAIVLAQPPRNRFPRWFAGLLFGVAGLGLLFSMSALRGWLVVSPELGLLFVEGGAIAYGSIVFLVLASALSLGLLVPVVGRAVQRPSRVFWSLLGSAVVAAFAIASIRRINPTDSWELQVVVYDLWSPALVLWLSFSLIESALRACRIDRVSMRLGVHAFFIAAIAWIATARFEFLTPATAMVWRDVGLAALVLSVGCLPVWLVAVARSDGGPARRSMAVGGLTLAAWAILIFAWWKWPDQRNRGAWALWVGSAILIGLLAWVRHRRLDPSLAPPSEPRRERHLMLLALAIMATSLFSVEVFDHGLITLGLLTAWVILAESTGEGALARYVQWLRAGATTADRSAWGLAAESLLLRGRAAGAYVFGLVKKPFAGSTILGGAVKALVAIVILLGLSEYQNAGTTIIGSFGVDSSAKQKDLGQAVANHLVFALHDLNERLRPDVALVTAGGGAKDRGFRFVAAKDETTSLDSALAKQPDVDLGPLKVPLGVLAAPIRGPARQLFGVRVISGAVHEGPPGTAVLARSTSGDAWKVPLGPDSQPTPTKGKPSDKRAISGVVQEGPPGTAVLARSTSGDARKAPLDPDLQPTPTKGKPSDTLGDTDAARDLAQQLALQIVASDRSAPLAGLTRSTAALEAFQQGWSAWKRFEIDEDLTTLATAIERFNEATMKDRHFALAHYRLALALQRAGRPGLATESFRASLGIDDRFTPGLIGLASTLYDYNSYFTSPPAAAMAVPASQGGDEKLATLFRKNEAARLWQKVVRMPAGLVSAIDRASAYAGLCLRAYDVALSLESASTLSEVRDMLEDFDAVAAFHLWTDLTALETHIRKLRREGKAPMPVEQAKMEELKAKLQEVLARLTQAQETLRQLDALGVDEARKPLVEVNEMFARAATSAPVDELEAKAFVARAIDLLNIAEHQGQERVPMQSLLTYFYCKRADKIYSSLADMRTNRDLRDGAARVAYLLGLTLERRHHDDRQQLEPRWSCMTQASLPRGPYSRAALRDYDRAVALAPENAEMRCQAALTASVVDDATRIVGLEADSDARRNLAEQYVAEVRGASGREAEDKYRRAIAEYAAAIARNPSSVEALNGYAYTFWMWHYAGLREAAGVQAPDPEVGRRAHGHAERALQLAEGKRPKMTEIAIRSTLGEVLLALGRFEEAYTVLQRTLDNDVVKSHAVFNEVRWDLAQSCLCVVRERTRSGRSASATEIEARATKLLDEIRGIELGEEYRPFSTVVDINEMGDVCGTGRDKSHLSKAPRPAPAGGLVVR